MNKKLYQKFSEPMWNICLEFNAKVYAPTKNFPIAPWNIWRLRRFLLSE